MIDVTAHADEAEQPRGEVPHANSELVVVVEPEDLVRASLCHVLNATGYRALGVADVVSLIELLRSHLVDLLIVDVALPVTGGIALCRGIRQQPVGRFLPIVMLGEQSSSLRLAALEAGADAYFTRPVDLRELLLVLHRLLDHCSAGNLVDRVSHLPTGQAARTLIEDALKQPAWAAVLFEVRGLRGINRRQGYMEGDRILAAVAGLLRELVRADAQQTILTRASGARFVAVVSPEAAGDLCQQATSAFRGIAEEIRATADGPEGLMVVGEPPLHLACAWMMGGPPAPPYPALIDDLTEHAANPDWVPLPGLPGAPPYRAES